MKKVYLYKGFERLWHWSQTILIFTLLATGFEINSSYELLGYRTAVEWHNYAAWSFVVLIVFAMFWHISTDAWRQYIPTKENFNAQINYYMFGIFRNAPHPTKKRALSKLNPLQRAVYFFLEVVIIPVMILSGLLYYFFHYPVGGTDLASLKYVAALHTLGAFILIAFVIVHLYLITTGRTLSSNLRAMVTGWEEMDDEEAKVIVEEAIEEAGQNIISMKNAKNDSAVKDIVIEALKETEEKIKENRLKGQR